MLLQQNRDNTTQNRVAIYKKPSGIYAEIETSRLFMRLYNPSDFQHCLNLYSDHKLAKYFDHGKPRTFEEVQLLIDQRSKIYTQDSKPFGLFSVFDKRNMAFMGQVDILPTDYVDGIVEIGCILFRQYHNKKYALEACNALIIDYINTLNDELTNLIEFRINKVTATAHPKNYASKKLIEGLGMQLEKSIERFDAPRLLYSFIPSQTRGQ